MAEFSTTTLGSFLSDTTTLQNQELPSTINGSDQPPFFIQFSRKSPATVELTNPVSGELLYTVRDTGRGRFSSQPDLEIFRPRPSSLFVGSIRMGRKEMEIGSSLSQKTFGDDTKFTSSFMPEVKGKQLQWRLKHKKRTETAVDGGAAVALKSLKSPQAAVVECFADGDSSPICVMQLYDTIPNGRIEIWIKDACVDVGGDWSALDQLVTLAYAHMEKYRRKMMRGVDQGSFSAGMVLA